MEGFLAHPVGGFLEKRSGDLCSLMGIAGAAMILVSRKLPFLEQPGQYSVLGSMGAAAVDTTIQIYNDKHDGGAAAEKRGATNSNLGSVLYAATGLLPGASLKTLGAIRHVPDLRTAGNITALGLNGVVTGYEFLHRIPRMIDGDENLMGYASFAAAFGGFVVARHALRVPHIPVPHIPVPHIPVPRIR
jgi:hypothetical protein